ncbi:unnamed protein product [Gongylonema pulchrum]|uniref:Cyclin-dependent kinases regulatory subunit n=1 Tax=Gongylonema pulchrum TaxID=637853 RepID=A0A183ESW6_9BILA|nr:unnamed protein product [Gongylonema pulchrum]
MYVLKNPGTAWQKIGCYFRHVHVPKEMLRLIPKDRLMSEKEWRNLGIQQSAGWVHYMIHSPERHVLLFRRPLPKNGEYENKNNAYNGAINKN